jgi:DMSO/TMAO reductase YedYZ molybdopterin-dependent catalytic subunit
MNGDEDKARRVSRRALLATIAAAGASLVAFTGGQSFGWLAPLNLFAPRVQGFGPQALPVNKTARDAGVHTTAQSQDWRLRVRGPSGSIELSRPQLEHLVQTAATLPIACVEGWSTSAEWSGVRMRDLLTMVGGPTDATIRISSLQSSGAYRITTMGPEFAQDATTLVALRLNGQTLDLDHGYPARVIAPGRPGVLQTKWLSSIEVLS